MTTNESHQNGRYRCNAMRYIGRMGQLWMCIQLVYLTLALDFCFRKMFLILMLKEKNRKEWHLFEIEINFLRKLYFYTRIRENNNCVSSHWSICEQEWKKKFCKNNVNKLYKCDVIQTAILSNSLAVSRWAPPLFSTS
ncbi:PREDICTED: uncharacterized protein LOC108363243 isoform X2 [Rhagoletis zephyria]|uniref:uncharacterized protein LOC108363243 isoform X2 n=1 Tax=Rhagoletis zephyria TaxID=28612 RepID=UPI0008114BEC|nr:PREDICTED: uncharacterized protein LOC108363243 isoform X2 [Rhagoletis zephyria]XP_036332913.1 uncharacterized protein LOC118744189 isoform X1 [Rhagoletis pomonella]